MELAVYEMIVFVLAEIYECQFGCIGHQAKHTLSAEYLPALYPIQPTDQCILMPNFHGVRYSFSVQIDICIYHILCDPCPSLASPPDTGAVSDDSAEVFIPGDAVFTRPHEWPHRVRYVQFIREYYKAFMRAIPEYRFALRVPGENTLLIRQDQSL
jgi:hypothetical protein